MGYERANGGGRGGGGGVSEPFDFETAEWVSGAAAWVSSKDEAGMMAPGVQVPSGQGKARSKEPQARCRRW